MEVGIHDEATVQYKQLRAHVDHIEATTPKEVDLEVEEMALFIRLSHGAVAEMVYRRNMRLQGRRA